MQPTDGQPAPGRDPSASSASTYNQQTVSKHGSQRFTSKSRPDMRVGVEDPTQPMWAASQTVRDPAGPYTRRAHSVCPDRLDGRRDSDGVKVTYRKTRDQSASVFLSSPPSSAGLHCRSYKSSSGTARGVYDDWNRRIQGRRCSRSPQQPREPPWREHPRILGPCLNNCMHSVERHSTTPMLLSSWRIRWARFPRAALSLPQLYCLAAS
jgi:hypothetical protein